MQFKALYIPYRYMGIHSMLKQEKRLYNGNQEGISAQVQEYNPIDEIGGWGLWGQRTPYKIFIIFERRIGVIIFLYIP